MSRPAAADAVAELSVSCSPKTTTFTADDKDLEFSTKFDKTAVKHKFKLKDMVFNGKVEM